MPTKRDQDGIYARADSPCWWCSITDGRGQQIRRSTQIPRASDPQKLRAKAFRAQWLLEVRDAAPPAPAKAGHTFDELMLLYFAQVTPTKRNPERDTWCARRLYPAFSGKVLETLTAADARGYIAARLAEGVKAGTVNKETGLFSAALGWAIKELEWQIPNPFRGRRLREPAGRNRWLTREEADRLLAAARASTAPHLEGFMRLSLNTGMRPGEVLGLEWSRVDLGAGLVYLGAEDQKSGRHGSVPLNQEARAVLIQRARFRATYCPASPWVFSRRDGTRFDRVLNGFASAVARAGLEDVHPHDLRRTFGSWLVQAGVDIRRVSELLRHADISVTARVYAHLAPKDLAAAVSVLDAVSRPGITMEVGHKKAPLGG